MPVVLFDRVVGEINCDKIILMNEGKVVSFGHYNELVKNSVLFKNLARS